MAAGLAFRRRFLGSASSSTRHRQPDHARAVLSSLGIGAELPAARPPTALVRLGLGAHLTWTLPFGLLIMFAVFGRFNRVLRGGRARSRRLAAGRRVRDVVVPIVLPGMIGVALFGFTLSYDEFRASC